MHYPIEGSDFWEKVVLATCHKYHQYCSCIQLAAVLFHFWWNYTTERFQTVHCADIMIRQSKSRVICINSCPTKTQKVADKLRYDGLGHYSISCPVWKCALWGKSCRKSCEKYKRSLHVKIFFQIFHEKWQYNDIIITTMYYIHYLKMFCNYCHIRKQCILSILNMFLTCQPQTIGRNPSYSLVFQKLNRLIPLTTKLDPAKNPTSS